MMTKHGMPFATIIGAALTMIAGPASAADTFAPPRGCTGYVTVQMQGCRVSNHYTCAGGRPGDQWDTYFDGHGPYFSSRIDAETQWLESIDFYPPETSTLLPGAADPASFSALIGTGRDDFDFSTITDQGEVQRFRGYDQLTGERVVVDGVVLEQTEFDLTASDAAGNMLWRRSGQQLIHRDWRIFFADTETFENAYGDVENTVSTPMEFVMPGEKGFFTTEPKYGCDALLTMLEVTP